MNVEDLFSQEVQYIVDDSNLAEGNIDEYKTRIDCATKLADRVIELKKLEQEAQIKAEERKADTEFKMKQLDEDRKDRFIRNCIACAGILIPVLVTIWGTKKSFEFEREGTITTIMGRGFINKLLPKK